MTNEQIEIERARFSWWYSVHHGFHGYHERISEKYKHHEVEVAFRSLLAAKQDAAQNKQNEV